MACDMCRTRRAAAEIAGSDRAREARSLDVTAELTAEGELWISSFSFKRSEQGNRRTVLMSISHCPWCGARLWDTTEE